MYNVLFLRIGFQGCDVYAQYGAVVRGRVGGDGEVRVEHFLDGLFFHEGLFQLACQEVLFADVLHQDRVVLPLCPAEPQAEATDGYQQAEDDCQGDDV